jgi:endonuclease/exonuclease/phosphatase family metal-dependent hydrolase
MAKTLLRSVTKKIFISTNIIIVLLFLLGSYGGWLNPNYFWPIGFLTLATFYLLLLLILFFLFWLFVKPRWCWLSIITILIAYKPITHIIPFRFSSDFKKQKTALRVMNWNVEHFHILDHKLHPEKKTQMIDLVNEYEPDIACFEEMVGSDSFGDAINYVPDMMKQMKFTTYHYAYNNKLNFDGKHHFGIITFSKFPIIHKQTLSYYPNDYNSLFSYVDIVKETDTLRVFTVHLQSLKFTATNLKYIESPEIITKESLKKSKGLINKLKTGFLKRKIQSDNISAEIAKSPYPVIICGDFNDVPNSYAYNTIGKGLKNAFVEKGCGIGRTYSAISPTLRIDNIFVSDEFDVQQFLRVEKKLSDHFPIISDVQLKK